MKTKTKLTLGVGLLFLLIVLLSVISIWYVNALKKDTENILVANYKTLAYSRQMLIALDDIPERAGSLDTFRSNLEKQLANLTEPGEREATNKLKAHFNELIRDSGKTDAYYKLIRQDIGEIMRLNMNAIARKSDAASLTAENANIWIGTTGALCFIIAFTLLINLPGNIANPIRELTNSIREITAHNYHQRVHFQSNNEFGELAHSFNIMAEKLEEYAGSNLSRLLMEKKRIETLINNMHDPVIGLDENQVVIFTNNEALQIVGFKKEEVIGKKIIELALYNDLLRLLAKDLNLQETKPTKKEPIKIFADGKESFFEKEHIPINIVPTGETRPQFIGHVIMLKNITPFRELDLAKTNFIATVSHELKTPISSIKMSLELLNNKLTGSLNNEQQQLVAGIAEDSNRLLRITGELLNMSQVETGNIQLNLRQSKPEEILHYALSAVQTAADHKMIHFDLQVEDPLPNVKVDPEKTAWVLTNFLSNAIRYSPEQGTIIISIRLEAKVLRFSVKDNGRGIDERYTQRIFERYFQIPGSNRSGSGLGLAISKEFIEAQGGEIGVESALGIGSTFYFSFPV
ncbi:MAG: ATP-binding protein [Pseudosphingobacterium sp.]|nr:cell wall metabolism sensor histidine kinase WalK [Olivibacter sp. UJ_SKK_5.1]MDX3915629.1 ATP-binding protein [Pseudosphingobacterium sp.]